MIGEEMMHRRAIISVNPPHTSRIFSGEKSVEWRKTVLPLGRHYVYETKRGGGCGKVIGEIEIVAVRMFRRGDTVPKKIIDLGCVSVKDLKDYVGYGDKVRLTANFIGDVKLYDEPKEISEFGLEWPPQSWCYVKEELHG